MFWKKLSILCSKSLKVFFFWDTLWVSLFTYKWIDTTCCTFFRKSNIEPKRDSYWKYCFWQSCSIYVILDFRYIIKNIIICREKIKVLVLLFICFISYFFLFLFLVHRLYIGVGKFKWAELVKYSPFLNSLKKMDKDFHFIIVL